MKKMTKTLACALTACVITATSVYAGISYRLDTTYYADPAMTQIVGFGFLDCDGTFSLDGTATAYKKTRRDSPCTGSGWGF